MDVRCDRCQTEYELDETRLTEAGVAVKCTNCGNVFKVRMRTTSQQNIPSHLVGSPPSLGPPPALGGPHRSWLVRRYDGSTLTLGDLTELQRAVIDRQVAPDDGVSIGGGAWHTLGSIPELASFFEVVRSARTRSGSSTGVAAIAPDGAPLPGRSLTPVWQDGPSAIGSVATHGTDPAWVARSALPDPEVAAMLEKEDKQVLRKSRVSGWVGGLLAVVVVAAAIAVYTVGVPGMSAPGTVAVPPVKPPDVNAMPRTAPPPEETHAPAAAAPGPVVPAAAAPAPVPAAAPKIEPKQEPKQDPKAAPGKAEPGTKKAASAASATDEAPAGRNFDYYIGQGHKLLDSKPSLALSMFDKAAELDASSPEPDSGRGLAYANMERLTDASGAFQAALRKSSEFTEAILGLAEVSARQGNRRKAIGLYQRYLDLTPDGPDAPAARAQLDELKAQAPAEPRAQPAPSVPPAAEASAAPAAATVPPRAAASPKATDLPPPPPPVVVPDTAPAAQ